MENKKTEKKKCGEEKGKEYNKYKPRTHVKWFTCRSSLSLNHSDQCGKNLVVSNFVLSSFIFSQRVVRRPIMCPRSGDNPAGLAEERREISMKVCQQSV